MIKKRSLEDRVADKIQESVGWFNGWEVSDEQEWKSCKEASKKVIRIIKREVKNAKDKAKSK